MLTIACVQVGNYCGRGEEYVRILADMVSRNLGERYRFVCFTDTPIEGIDCERVPEGLTGWWAKLWLFEALKDERVLYLDLDTVITGALEPFAAYEGRFAILRDFYRPDGYGSGVMLWNSDHSHIWRAWDEAGRPQVQGGDQAWIERVVKDADRVQDIFPELACSFKVHAEDWPPAGSSLVCFHGNPKPHNCLSEWVPQFWKMGGIARPRFIQGLNTPPETMLAQAEENLRRDLPVFVQHPEHQGTALIVGGGPSLQDALPNLRMHRNNGGHVFALNGTHDWLIERGIVPDFHVLLDAREDNARFVAHPHKRCTYLVAAQCHPVIFDALEGYDVIQWLAWLPGMRELAERTPKPLTIVGGGNTVGLKAMCIAALWGYRNLRLYGFDSSYRDEQNHAYRQELNDGEATLEIVAAGRKFKCARWMARQAVDFQKQSQQIVDMGCRIKVVGDGLIPWIAKQWDKQEQAA